MLTDNCNLNCSFCYATDSEVSHQSIPFAHCKNILLSLKIQGCNSISFTGGEPLLYQYSKEIFYTAKHLGFHTTLYTNGTIIDENLLDSNIIDSFIVSVDGPSDIHDILRKRRGSYKSTIQNINKIIKKNIPLTLATTVSSQNFETLDELSVLIKKIKPNFWRINSCLPIGKALNNILFANSNNIYKKIVTYSLDKDLPLIITDLHSVKSLKIDYQKQIDNFFSSIWISPDTSISLYPRSLGAKTICLPLENLTLLDYLYKEISQDFDSYLKQTEAEIINPYFILEKLFIERTSHLDA